MTSPSESSTPTGTGIPYLGIPQSNPGQNWYRHRDPTVRDFKNYQVLDRWVNQNTTTVFILTSKAAGSATWVPMTGASAGLQSLTGDAGGAVGPDAFHNINIVGGPGIDVVGTPGTNTLTVLLNGGLEGTGTTIGAVTADLITVPLGTTPGVYLFKIDVVGFDAITPLGTAYFITAAARTTGAAAVEIGGQASDDLEEGALIAGDADMVCFGNDAIIRVTGTAGKTISWRAVLTYTFRS